MQTEDRVVLVQYRVFFHLQQKMVEACVAVVNDRQTTMSVVHGVGADDGRVPRVVEIDRALHHGCAFDLTVRDTMAAPSVLRMLHVPVGVNPQQPEHARQRVSSPEKYLWVDLLCTTSDTSPREEALG